MAGDDEKEEPTQASAEVAETSTPAAEEEDTGAEVAPIVKLDAVAVSTCEENEDALIDLKAKLYRFDKEGSQWKERGVGQVKLLKHKETEKVRLVMRQSKTLKICANHTVVPSISLHVHQGNDKTWVWHASDYADGELKEELFCIRFGSVENAQAFKKSFEDAQKAKVTSGDKETEEVGSLLESLKVGDRAESEEGKEENSKSHSRKKEMGLKGYDD